MTEQTQHQPKTDQEVIADIREELQPVLMKTSDVLDLKNKHQKELFHGYFLARWGFMDEETPGVFTQIYNEGIRLFASSKTEITLERMEKYFCIMRDTWFPGELPNEQALVPRVFRVIYASYHDEVHMKSHDEITMSIVQVGRNWPWLLSLIEQPSFLRVKVELKDESMEVEKLPEISIKPT